MSTKLINSNTVNFRLKNEFIFSNQLTDRKLIIEIDSNIGSNRVVSYGRIQPIFFVRENGFVDGQSFNLNYGKNFIDIDPSFAINYRLKITPYARNRKATKISIYRKLLPENVSVISLNDSNLFIGSL